MTHQQLLLAAILAAMLAAFIAGRWRYDMVAMAGLLAAALVGLVPADHAFAGFGNPAVITVAGVLVLTRTLVRTGVFDAAAGRLLARATSLPAQLAVLCGLGAVTSAFMNNIGALALVMPMAMAAARRQGRSPALYLMPLSYATLLGGMTTLIGTPANLLVSGYRAEALERSFGLFAITPVALPLAVIGLGYLVLVGWVRSRRSVEDEAAPSDHVLTDTLYDTELTVVPGSRQAGRGVGDLERDRRLRVYGILRDGRRVFGRIADQTLRAGDILLAQVDAAALPALADGDGLVPDIGGLDSVDGVLAEAVVAPNALIQGSCAASLDLEGRWGVTLVAAMRQRRRAEGRLAEATLSVGDVLLLHGERPALRSAMADLGCLPLADRGLTTQPRRALVGGVVFALAVLLAAFEALPPAVAFGAGVLTLAAARVVRPSEIYEAIDWPVIVLLAAMIPLGDALQTTGTAGLIAGAVIDAAGPLGIHALLILILATTMLITPVLNNPATVLVMAPIALGLASRLGAPADPFLIAVAIGASCDFLTPFGHHNNALVMGPGGYRFADYARLGAGLELLVILLAPLLITLLWGV